MERNRGFTLLEVIIVIVILAVLAALAYPLFQRWAINGNLRTGARDLSSDFQLLRERALAENRMYRIDLNFGNNSYTLQQCNSLGSSCASWTVTETKNLATVGSDIVFNQGATTATDYRLQTRGTVTNNTNQNPAAIVLTNSRGSRATLTISLTGRANVQFLMQ